MSESERKIIGDLIAAESVIYGMQADIDREQERVIADLVSPAETVVKKLIALDNRRIDLCNIKVLNEYIRRETGGDRSRFTRAVPPGDDDSFWDTARAALNKARYTASRVKKEFSYIFACVKNNRRRAAILSALTAVGVGDISNYGH